LKQREVQKILVRATNWVGDAVMSLPALQALRQRYPAAHISVLARPWVAGLYGRESFCDEVIPYEAPKGWRGFNAKRRLAVVLRKRRFDCAVLLQNAFEAAAVARWAGIPTRIGYNRDGRGWLLTHPIPVPAPGEIPAHQRFYYLELLKRAKLIEAYSLTAPIRLEGAAAAAEQGRAWLNKAQMGEWVIGISPGAAYGGAKRWLPERFAMAAVQLAGEYGASVAIFGSKGEHEMCEAVRALVAAAGVKCEDFAGVTTLPRLIEMVAACRLFLTNDSGSMHIASALGVPTVAVFGATDDHATGPTGDASRVVRESVECSPCLLRECPIDHRCMTGVHAASVVSAGLELIEIQNK
jgi:heptosyltransferase II